jgi:aminoglycoside phosphotransferase (APT) family kinase protein
MADSVDDLASLAADLSATFPDLQVAMPLRVLGAGFHSLVVETGDGIVFRVAKNREATEGHAREAALLPALRTRLPLTIPEPTWYTGPSALFPFGVIGYRKVPGMPLEPSRLMRADTSALAAALGAFLHALHSFPAPEALALGVTGPDVQRGHLEQVRTAVLPPLRAALSAGEYRRVEQWWDHMRADPAMTPHPAALCHGDLWYENVLVDPMRSVVTGVVDFEHANVGDPAQDFAALRYLGDRFVAATVDAYRLAGGLVTPTFAHRLERYWELREFGGVHFAVTHADEAEFADSLRKLRAGAILNPAAHPPLRMPSG